MRKTQPIALGAFTSLVLLVSMGCAQKTVNDVMADPHRYRNKTVSLQGEVVESFSVAGHGFYRLDDLDLLAEGRSKKGRPRERQGQDPRWFCPRCHGTTLDLLAEGRSKKGRPRERQGQDPRWFRSHVGDGLRKTSRANPGADRDGPADDRALAQGEELKAADLPWHLFSPYHLADPVRERRVVWRPRTMGANIAIYAMTH